MTIVRLPPSAFRLLVMGTGPFAVPTFQSLLQSPHSILALVTRPDRPVHSREKSAANPTRAVAQGAGLEVFEPASINSPEAHAWLTANSADLFVVCDYGQILSRETLSLSRLGGINLHASLLPKYRGAAPINWAIYHGETETGVTVIHMTPQLDAGPTLVQRRTPIAADETAPQLEARLAQIGVGAVMEAVILLASGSTGSGLVQNPAAATKAPRLKKQDGLIDWSRSAAQIYNQIRAFQPWPKSYTWLRQEGLPEMRLILESVQIIDEPRAQSIDSSGHASGEIISAQGDTLIVRCGQGALRILALQSAGKRLMPIAEFLRGHPLQPGQKFIPNNGSRPAR
jgi:methionyl-tRNA formyltransferase